MINRRVSAGVVHVELHCIISTATLNSMHGYLNFDCYSYSAGQLNLLKVMGAQYSY